MNNALARKEGRDASRSCSFRMRKRALAACGAGERAGVCDDMLARSLKCTWCPCSVQCQRRWRVDTCGSATSISAHVTLLLALRAGLAAMRSVLRRLCVERIRSKALLPFGLQQRISRIQPYSAEGSRR